MAATSSAGRLVDSEGLTARAAVSIEAVSMLCICSMCEILVISDYLFSDAISSIYLCCA